VVIHGRVLGVAPKSYCRPTEFYERRQVAAGDDGVVPYRCCGRAVRRDLVAAADTPGFVLRRGL
jgi:hypothetical protein